MSSVRCKFYLQGSCRFGSSCRFVHEEPQRSNLQSRSNRNVSTNYYETDSTSRDYKDYNNDNEYEQNNYEPGRKSSNYSYNKRDYNIKNDYNNRNVYNNRNDYNSRNDYNNRNDYNYEEGDSASNHYGYQAQTKQRNLKNYYKEDDYNYGKKHNFETNRHDYSQQNHTDKYKAHAISKVYSDYPKEDDYNQGRKHISETTHDNYSNKRHDIPNRYDNSETPKYIPEHCNVNDKEKDLKKYEKEIKTYQAHINQLSMSNIWPFTCFHPIGQKYAIQPVGSLNFIDVSVEEIRCDYYLVKSVSANPGLIHKKIVNDLLLKAQKQKKDIFTFASSTQYDLLATFNKCERSKSSNFINTIQMDDNSYWDMSIRSLKIPEKIDTELESFSFVNLKTNMNIKKDGQLKILMQTEVYGKMDNEVFAQDQFTDFIPIMPPSKKYCV